MTIPVFLYNVNTESPAPIHLICNDVDHQSFQTVDAAFPRQRISAAQAAVSIHTGGQNGSAHKTACVINKVNIADGGIQHACPNGRCKLLNTISKQRTVVALVVIEAITGNVVGLHLSVLAEEIAKLMDGWITLKQHAAFIAIPVSQHLCIRCGQAVFMTRVVKFVQCPAHVLFISCEITFLLFSAEEPRRQCSDTPDSAEDSA